MRRLTRSWDPQRERDKIVHDIQVEQQKAQVELRVIQQLLAEQLYLVSQRGPTAAKPEALPGLSDFSDVYQKLEDEPEKRTVVLKTLDKELLEETLQHAQRKAESFAFDCAEVMRKEVEVCDSVSTHVCESVGLKCCLALNRNDALLESQRASALSAYKTTAMVLHPPKVMITTTVTVSCRSPTCRRSHLASSLRGSDTSSQTSTPPTPMPGPAQTARAARSSSARDTTRTGFPCPCSPVTSNFRTAVCSPPFQQSPRIPQSPSSLLCASSSLQRCGELCASHVKV